MMVYRAAGRVVLLDYRQQERLAAGPMRPAQKPMAERPKPKAKRKKK